MPQYLVTGPQRSGTTITAHILANDLDLPYFDETEFNPNNIPENCVIQAPFALKHVIELSFRHPDLHFIYVIRDMDSIIASMERVGWYKDHIDHPDFYSKYIAHCKLLWSSCKLLLDENRWTEIEYEQLQSHPFFVNDRANFVVRQWQPNTSDLDT